MRAVCGQGAACSAGRQASGVRRAALRARQEVHLLEPSVLDDKRLDEIALDGEPRNTRANFVSGLKTLPVRYRMR